MKNDFVQKVLSKLPALRVTKSTGRYFDDSKKVVPSKFAKAIAGLCWIIGSALIGFPVVYYRELGVASIILTKVYSGAGSVF